MKILIRNVENNGKCPWITYKRESELADWEKHQLYSKNEHFAFHILLKSVFAFVHKEIAQVN
jgi:hypothetical protein